MKMATTGTVATTGAPTLLKKRFCLHQVAILQALSALGGPSRPRLF